MDKNEFEAQCHEIQTTHDREVELWHNEQESGDCTWEVMRERVNEQSKMTLESLRSVVNNYLYGVNSWAVYHPNPGVRVDEDLNPYPTAVAA